MPTVLRSDLVDADRPTRKTLRRWTTPTLTPIGTVAQVTAKIDSKGRNDGGGGQKKRT